MSDERLHLSEEETTALIKMTSGNGMAVPLAFGPGWAALLISPETQWAQDAVAEMRKRTWVNRMRWFVCDMDDGVLRIEPTRKAAVDWWKDHCDTTNVIRRHNYGPGKYEYQVGASEDDSSSAFIVREDLLEAGGWDPNQLPMFPFPEHSRRHEATEERRTRK